ncbi:MAG: chromate resistance protein [Verrucomicrobia bacterium]|nr:chromate resistance protein [Verrucomicrobiota bacterium]
MKVWRRLKKFGAMQLKTSTYVLPDEPVHYERFQSLAKEIVENGGEAALVRVKDIEGTPYSAVVAMFNEARSREYDEISEPLMLLIREVRGRTTSPEQFSNQLRKLQQRFEEIYEIDFFKSSRGEDLQKLFRNADLLECEKGEPERKGRLRAEKYKGKAWIIRPRPEIDQVGSAWLIRNFIDPGANFVFSRASTEHRSALQYIFMESEFNSHIDCCTFERLIDLFGIRERAVLRLAETIHDADLEDDKFHRVEGIGIDQMLKGWAKLGLGDEEILSRGFQCLDGLYVQFKPI